MKATLVVEGKEFPIEINDPELQKLIAPPKKTGYELVKDGQTYSFVNNYGEVITVDHQDDDDDNRYSDANYYSSAIVAENNARADKLMRQLRRFAVESRIVKPDWNKKDVRKWVIYYDATRKVLDVTDSCFNQYFGTIYFDLALRAKQAIANYTDELIWYFTEYKDSL